MTLDREMLMQLIVSVVVIIILTLVYMVARVSINRFVRIQTVKDSRAKFFKKLVRTGLVLFGLFVLISVWGVNIKNLWVFVTGIVGIVAIGFFAVWSILSNVVAGLLLFFSDPFRFDDEVVILPDDVRGKVVDMKLLFVVLRDAEGNVIHIPNNVFFQKVIKKVKEK